MQRRSEKMAKITPLILATIFIVLFTTPSCLGDNTLYSDETLYAGQYLSYGPYKFIIQNDCNLVLYDSGKPIWASNTGGLASGCRLTMQHDGNLVVYASTNRAIWASNTNVGNGNYVLILQKDRNTVIYGSALWATGTYIGLLGIPGSAQNSTIMTGSSAQNSTIMTGSTETTASA